MKQINNLFILLSLLLLTGACEKDGDKFFLSSPETNELMASSNRVVLTPETAKFYALSLAWTEQTLQVSDERYQATTGVQTSIQVSRTEDFKGQTLNTTESGLSKTYSIAALNIVAYLLNATPNEEAPLYFRLAGRNGSNIDPVYSNVVKVMVTPYEIDMRFANILNKGDGKDSGKDLYAANADGNYVGFMGVSAWDGFYLEEADGNIWHTAKSGTTGTPFLITTDAPDGTWDLWFPGQSGCYYTNVNTAKKQWNALWMEALQVEGINGGITMEYKRSLNQWQGVFTATAAGEIQIQVNGTGKLYDNTSVSGAENTIDDTKAKDTPFAFNGSANELIFSTGSGVAAGNITVNVPAAGECTLIIDLNNPLAWKVEATEGGSVEPEPEAAPYIYLPGIGPEDNWAYDRKISLYNQEELKYAGVVDVDSKWGNYAMSTVDAWDESKLYTLASGTAASGTLIQGNGDNIPAPANGLYLFEVSLDEQSLTYTTSAVESVSCYLGIDGEGLVSLQAGATTGVYTGTITLSQDTQWGIKFVINNWTGSYGGYDGKLYYNANDGIKPLAAGTYNVTVDFINETYTLTNQ